MKKRDFLKTTLAATLAFSGVYGVNAYGQPVTGKSKKFSELVPEQPTDPEKIEVIEFFWYACPHCAYVEPLLEAWEKRQPADVKVTRVPVAFNASMQGMQLTYCGLEAINRLDIHPKVFRALHEERVRFNSKSDVLDWLEKQGVNRKQIESAFNSFGVRTKMARADKLTQDYKIDSTPQFAIAGKFKVSPPEAGGYQQAIDQVDLLVNTIRASKKREG